MTAGELIHRVSIQTRSEASDGHDGVVESWTTGQARIASRVVGLAGRDLERARQIDPRASYEVTLRYWSAYNDSLVGGRARVIWHDTGAIGDRTLEIVGPPRETEHRATLVLVCGETR